MDNAKPFRALSSTEAVGPQVYRILREQIIQAELLPGERISESEIAKALSISRQPVREAFIKLSEEGLVQVLPQRGAFDSDTREEPSGTRPGQDIRVQLRIGLGRRGASDRTARHGRLGTHGELAGKQLVGAALAHDQHDEVGRRSADLEPDAASLDAHGSRRTPTRARLVPT